MNNPYDVLGVTPDAGEEEIKNAYYARVSESGADSDKLGEIDQAYAEIMNNLKNPDINTEDETEMSSKDTDLSETNSENAEDFVGKHAQKREPNKIIGKISELFAVLLNTKEKRTIAMWAGVALAAVIAVLIIALNIKSDKVGKALNSDIYDRVQVTVTQKMISLENDSSFETTDDEYTSEGGDYYDYNGEYGDVYYDENGSMVTEGTDTSSQTDRSYEQEDEICVMKKDGDTIYEEGLGGKYYRYSRDGHKYILYYDDFYGIKADNGDWVEMDADNYGLAPVFDFSVLDGIKKSDLKKTSDGYVPKSDTEDIFFKVLQIQNKEKYTNSNIKFYFKQGKITKISATYIYSNSYDITQNYKFTYKDEEIKVPAPTADSSEE